MKKNLTYQNKPGSGEIALDLPSYLLGSTVLTEDYQVLDIATSIRQEEGQRRKGQGQQPAG